MTTTTARTTTTTTTTPTSRPAPWTAAVSAAVAALMVVGGFAMIAIAPVTVTLVSTLLSARLRALRWWAAGLAALYSTGLLIWAVRPDPAPSLTKDLHPVLAGLIIAAALAVVTRHLLLRRSATRNRS